MALALVGLLTTAAPPTWTQAQAQVAKDLQCKGCVSSKDIKKKGVKRKNLDKKLQQKLDDNMMGANRRSFYAQINANQTRDLLVFGTFVLFAQCILNQGVGAQLQVGLRSTADGWFRPFSGSPLPSTAEIFLATIFAVAGARVFETYFADGGLGPTGSLLGFIYLAMGLNIIGNACLVQGWADTSMLE